MSNKVGLVMMKPCTVFGQVSLLLFFAKIEGWRPLAARAYFPLAMMICKLSPTQGENNQ
jgi:hypothetical protein